MLPFTLEQFLAVFANYNAAIWPVQFLAYLLGAIALALSFRRGARSDRTIAAILAVMWAVTGIGYHLTSFAAINKAAYGFGALFLIEAAALAYAGVYRNHLNFGFRADPAGRVGVFFVVYAAVLYPLVGIATGHHYPELPMFGVTPCPVTIFTLGMLLLTVKSAFRLSAGNPAALVPDRRQRRDPAPDSAGLAAASERRDHGVAAARFGDQDPVRSRAP